MVKALSFKGDKKPKSRKRKAPQDHDDPDATDSKQLATTTTASAAAEEDDSWVSAEATGDVSGPVIFVLPTEPATCIACDANGKVFPIAIENMVDGDPTTSEPHDVRQVWVANRVAGTESFGFKGHHGRYLGCDKFGMPHATSEAISPEESWIVIEAPDQAGAFCLQTAREKFLAVDDDKAPPEVRGDADTISFGTTIRIRMQARFKPRLKANKEQKALEKISRKELEDVVGRRLEDDEVRKLKRARREGNYHEILLDVKVKGKHDKYA
ncbi:hypothetical protein B0A49_00605 [Cryomyces minteri]|uniref:Protein frg1 n=1 Tax=Cryomyces minteri TaxID=331657 RepID=A0A4U0XZ49_9PEZI|nr:hypothetical protein B0A49_00605 [Cryomyces minteri]